MIVFFKDVATAFSIMFQWMATYVGNIMGTGRFLKNESIKFYFME